MLDVGCGSAWLAEHFERLHGRRRLARRRSRPRPSAAAACCSRTVDEPLPFDDAAFDGVVVKDLLEHVEDPVVVVREVLRVLRAGRARVRLLARRPALGVGRLHAPPAVHPQGVPPAVRRPGLRGRARRLRVGDAGNRHRVALDAAGTGVRRCWSPPPGCRSCAATSGCSRAGPNAPRGQTADRLPQADRGIDGFRRQRAATARGRPHASPRTRARSGVSVRWRTSAPGDDERIDRQRLERPAGAEDAVASQVRKPRAKPASSRWNGLSTPAVAPPRCTPRASGAAAACQPRSSSRSPRSTSSP